MFETTLHHTLKDNGNPEYIEENGPFPVQDIKSSYLGSGYYFWDDHIELAHWWGDVHCRPKYVICQCDFKIDQAEFYDLVGSRQNMMHFEACIKKLNLQDKSIGTIIETLKEINRKNGYAGTFPFKAVRALEDQKGGTFKKKTMQFADNRPGETTINPRIMVCLFKKDAKILSGFKIIYPEDYVN